MFLPLSYYSNIKAPYELDQTPSSAYLNNYWEIVPRKERSPKTKRFAQICLFEFFEVFKEGEISPKIDKIKAFDFTNRWGPLFENSDKSTSTDFEFLRLKLETQLSSNQKLLVAKDKRAKQLEEEFAETFSIVIDDFEGRPSPHLRPKDLASALTITALVRGRSDYVRCSFYSEYGQRSSKCPIGCWVRAKGRAGRKSNIWANDNCRRAYNYRKEKEDRI